MARFTDKVAIITGSSYGIGRNTAILFAKEGAKVTITGRNAERLEETRKAILAAGVPAGNVNSVIGDVTKENVQDELIASTLKAFGKINILVNNAGAAVPDSKGAFGMDQAIDTYDRMFDLNVRTVVALTKKARPHLSATKGEVVNVSSIVAGAHAIPKLPYYSMSKAALDQFTRNSAVALSEEGIRVNSVSPGMVSTGFEEAGGMTSAKSKKFYDFVNSDRICIPGGKVGHPDDIANAIAFLADRNASSYILGHTIVADGGTHLVLGMAAHDFGKILGS